MGLVVGVVVGVVMGSGGGVFGWGGREVGVVFVVVIVAEAGIWGWVRDGRGVIVIGGVAVVMTGDTRGAVGGEAEGSELDVVGSVELVVAVVFAGCFGNGLIFFGR